MLAKLTFSYTPRFTYGNPNLINAPVVGKHSQTALTCRNILEYILVLNPTDVRSARESLPSSLIFNSTSEHIPETNPTSAGFQVKNNVAVKSTGILSKAVFDHYKVH